MIGVRLVGFLVLGFLALPLGADEDVVTDSEPEEHGLRFEFGLEAKAHFRSSEFADARTFPDFPDTVGSIDLTTVDPGEHFEISAISLLADAFWGGPAGFQVHLKLDGIDLYERNPTSTDREVDIDELWIRYGHELEPGQLPEGRGAYLKLGKLGKFERQDDRHLESYGLAATTFNRLEDVGLEVGFDLHRNVYLKLSATQGNPVFFRDPNALAGDVGDSLTTPSERELGGGLGLIYDAEVEDFDIDGLELGAGLGFRSGDEVGDRVVDLLLWGYERDLDPTVALRGSRIGGDLELLTSLPGSQPLAVTSDRKREVGLNLQVYWSALSIFGQYVDSDLAGLERRAYELELAHAFGLPYRWAVGGAQLFPEITAVARYSRLFNDFEHPAVTVLPSLAWDWYKLDLGFRLAVYKGVDLTAEYTFNHGYLTDNNEVLVTLRWLFR